MAPNHWEIRLNDDGTGLIAFFYRADGMLNAKGTLALDFFAMAALARTLIDLTPDETPTVLLCWECGGPIAPADLIDDEMGPAHRSCIGA